MRYPDITFMAANLIDDFDAEVRIKHITGAYNIVYHLEIPGIPFGQISIVEGKWRISMHLRLGHENEDRSKLTMDDFDAIIDRLPKI